MYFRNSKSEIPNITGWAYYLVVSARDTGGAIGVASYSDGNMSFNAGNYKRAHENLAFNASWSSNRYGSYTEVRPLYEACKFAIKY